MANHISLTIRLPDELNAQLQTVSKEIGVTKTNLLRAAIHDFLTVDNTLLNFSLPQGKKVRLILNINQMTHDILQRACKKHAQSMNAVVTAVGVLALERASKWLQATKL